MKETINEEDILNIGIIELKIPIKVNIIKNDDYIASIENLNLYSYGTDESKVISELKDDLLELYLDLFYEQNKLSKPALKLKNQLKYHISG